VVLADLRTGKTMKVPAAQVHGDENGLAADIAILNQLSAVQAAQNKRAAGRDAVLRLLKDSETAVERLVCEIQIERNRVVTAGGSTGEDVEPERARATLLEKEQALAQARADLVISTAGMTPEIEAAADELASLERRARSLAGGLSAEAARIYASLARARRSPFAATLKDECCDGCNMRLPSSLLGEIRRVAKLHSCPFCKRVLCVATETPP
jgi:predicted  nucleic acid-binding Zn-ribbon protein